MKAYFTNLPARVWALIVLPAALIAYPIGRIMVPAVMRAIVPDVVRSVLHIL